MRLQIKEIIYLLSAMKDVATAHGKQTLTPLQQSSLRAVYSQVFGHEDELQLTHLIDTPLSGFSQVIPDAIKAEYVLRFLVITALMDKTIDREKILTVLDYAKAANIYPHYLNQLNKTLEGDFQWLIKDIMRKNLESFDIFPNIQDEKDIENWLFPYRGDKKNPQLAERYESLRYLPEESFGHHIWMQFKTNNYKFPGEEEGANYEFIMPHDSIHVLSEYDTSPYGELLVSVFTSTMLEKNSIDGHVIPVMYSFYLGIKLNELAGSAQVEIDPFEFWDAWYRGSQMQINLYSKGWNIWDVAEIPLTDLRALYHVLPKSLGNKKN